MMKLSERALKELGISPPFLSPFIEESEPAFERGQRDLPEQGHQENSVRPSLRSAEQLSVLSQLEWAGIPEAIEACTACGLHQGRKRAVAGIGDPKARWLFIGEAPGAEEDQRGEPFVGAAGLLLDSMLAALNLSRNKDIFIANVIKCRPPNNRTPVVTECQACLPFLERQIALIQPQVIVALGRVAAQSLLQSEINLGSLRNKVHTYRGVPLIVTFHPAYLLRNLPEKAKAWADLCLAKKTFDQA